MKVHSIQGLLPLSRIEDCDMQQLAADVEGFCPPDCRPLRFSFTEMSEQGWHCEMEGVQQSKEDDFPEIPSIFSFRRRQSERNHAFNVVFLIPTGIGCEVGGNAGDATPAARLLASMCDHLILHPNVVNASDINEQSSNSLYVEGSLICQLLMGTISLRKVRRNRILVITEAGGNDWKVIDQVANTTNASNATLGTHCSKVVVVKQGFAMTIGKSPSGRATGDLSGLEYLFRVLREERAHYDAVALSTRILAAGNLRRLFEEYFQGEEGVNPWGGIEAVLTHSISLAFGIPSAHAPMLPDSSWRAITYGQVDPRKAAETISTTYMFCVLKGLHQAPVVVSNPDGIYDPSVLAAEDISCLVVPDTCVGLPTLAALHQGIPVIAVRNNTNVMKNDLRRLPFAPGQLWFADNYFEAAGLLAALKAGLHPASINRPLERVPVLPV